MKVFNEKDKKNPDLNLHIPIVLKFTSEFMKTWTSKFDYDDVYSEVLYQVFRALKNYDPNRGNVSTLLYNSKRNILIKAHDCLVKLYNEHHRSKKLKLSIHGIDTEYLPSVKINAAIEEEERERERKIAEELLDRLSNTHKRHHLVARMKCNKVQFTQKRSQILFGVGARTVNFNFAKRCGEIGSCYEQPQMDR